MVVENSRYRTYRVYGKHKKRWRWIMTIQASLKEVENRIDMDHAFQDDPVMVEMFGWSKWRLEVHAYKLYRVDNWGNETWLYTYTW